MVFQDVRKTATQAYIKYKTKYDEKQTPQNLNKQIMFTSYEVKRITKEANIPYHIFDGLDFILLNWCYQTTMI